MRSAAAFAGITDRRLLDTLTRFALFCGLAFQVQDDLRSFGSSRHNGKLPAEDILEGKVTLPLLRFFETCDAAARDRVRRFLSLPRAERDPAEARRISCQIIETGCIDYGQEVAYVAAAQAAHIWAELARQLLPCGGTEFLAELPRLTVTHR
jgi:geranylgeranyl pyrophosphate synthase